jgi:ferritin-like protein
MSSEGYHEPYELISAPTKELHRAIVTLIEELEAIDWYGQRSDVCQDDELRAVLLHNRKEEIEHAMMVLEWIRRNSAEFDEKARTYLFTQAPITEVEEEAMQDAPGAGPSQATNHGCLGIGSLKG